MSARRRPDQFASCPLPHTPALGEMTAVRSDAKSIARVPQQCGSRLFLFLITGAIAAAVSGCGGGGGGSNPLPPAPAPAPSPPPPAIATIDSTKIVLTEVPAPCPGATNCFGVIKVFVDSSAELTAMWMEYPSTGLRLAAANVAAGSNSVLSTGALEAGFLPMSQLFRAKALGNRRFVVLHAFPFGMPSIANPQARVVEMKGTGSPDVGSPTLLPQLVPVNSGVPTLWEDSASQLYGAASLGPMPTPPFPTISLGSGVKLQTTLPFVSPLFDSFVWRDAEYSHSADPRILWGLIGRQQAGQDPHAYIAEQRLTTGAVLPVMKVSTQPVISSNAQVTCLDTEVEPAAFAGAGPTFYAMPWRQLNATGSGCDLFVNGQRVNTGTQSVVSYRIGMDSAGTVAVWNERLATPGNGRVLWSRLLHGASTWSPPMPLSTEVPATDQELSFLVRGAGGTLAAVWRVTSTQPFQLVSKYRNGGWTTSRLEAFVGAEARAVAINAAGQAGVVFQRQVQCGSANCLQLEAYRF